MKRNNELLILNLIETGNKISNLRYISLTHPKNVEGINFSYYKNTLNDYISYTKKDIIFSVLLYFGILSDQYLANQYKNIDVIGGYFHKLIEKSVFYFYLF